MKKPAYLLILLFAITSIQAQSTLLQDFQNPPNEARPRVWWHWMNGNVTKNGIQHDLEWMERTGIGGFQNFDANLFTPLVVEKKLVFMTPEWKDAFRFATELANQKGLEMAIAGSPGWSVTGGPWVPAEDGMKKYVWTETRVIGGQPFNGKLPQPAATTGKFQNAGLPETSMLGEAVVKLPEYYHDALVVAYRLLPTDKSLAELKPKLTSSGGDFNLKDLTDSDLNTTTLLPPMAAGEDMWIQYEFDSPQTFKAFSVAGANHINLEDFNGGPLNRSLKVSDDGVNFREIATVSGSINPQNTVAFAPTSAKFWRMTYKTLAPEVNPWAAMFGGGSGEPPKPDGVNVAEFVLHTTDRIDQFEDKAGFIPWKEDNRTYSGENAGAIPTEQVVDLTQKMKPDGSLDWMPSAGDWIVLRFGYSLTGRQNHPASPEATGLEVDKLDPDAVRKYINAYLDMYKDATGGLMGEKGLSHMILDSYEAGHMTWTKSFPQEFKKRRDYDIATWIPVLTGRIVKSREASEAFLWDFRKTIGELIAENHYDVIGEELHKRGMKRYTESHEDRRIYLADGMDVKRNAGIPMSAMWTPGSLAAGADEEVRSEADIREAASVAHIYGKPFVAAESMTSIGNAFSWHPEKLKRTADLEMASGLNRFVVHTSVHQPLDDKMPGFSLGPFGQYFGRQETWSGAGAKAWVDYLSRSCHLLQRGRFVADALVFYGENTNITWRFREKLPSIPGYEYDFVNATILSNDLKVENGKITTPGGGSYSVLFLDETAREMTLPVLKKLRDLVNAGAVVTGTKPEKSPSLADDPAEFQQIVNEIWASPKVYGKPAADVLRMLGISEDVLISDLGFGISEGPQPKSQIPNPKPKILYVHRKIAVSEVSSEIRNPKSEIDIYWLNSRSAEANGAEVSFRVSGRVPELWNAQTGQTSKVSWRIENGRTVVPLEFDPWGAFFIVFKEKTNETSFTLSKTTETETAKITGAWQVSFQEKRGAPASAVFQNLTSWSEHADAGIKYFSGTATYRNSFAAPKLATGNRLLLDLGEVKNIAEVIVNGKPVGTLWKTPFKLDITGAVKTGKNDVEIRVTNTWVNRLIGDAQPGVKEKITFTTMPFYRGNEPLLPSGLLGPVKLVVVK